MPRRKKKANGNGTENGNGNGNGNNENIVKSSDVFSMKTKKKVSISARSFNQKELFRSIEKNIVTIAAGPAGCGKTKIAVCSSLIGLLKGDYEKMIFSRPCVEAEGENLGFLPGNFNDKIYPYMMPIFNFMSEYLDKHQIEELIKNDVFITLPLAYQRGLTFSNAFVILDEAQNTTPRQMRMFLTRIGDGCKVIVDGDPNQSDIRGKNGLIDAVKRLEGMEGIGIVELTDEDIVRHPIVAKIENKYLLDLD
jgi:phosphate starvation-inducible protein PhoH and related proteins